MHAAQTHAAGESISPSAVTNAQVDDNNIKFVAPQTRCDVLASSRYDDLRVAAPTSSSSLDGEAVAACSEALKDYPNSPRLLAYYIRAIGRSKLGTLSTILQHREALEASDYPYATLLAARISFGLGEFERAERDFTLAVGGSKQFFRDTWLWFAHSQKSRYAKIYRSSTFLEWLKADHDELDPVRVLIYAGCLQGGTACPLDRQKPLDMYVTVAKRGDAFAALNALAVFFGSSRAADLVLGEDPTNLLYTIEEKKGYWFKGDTRVLAQLIYHILKDEGGDSPFDTHDKDIALKILKEQTKENDQYALYILGYLHHLGVFVKKSPEKAFLYIRKSASLGNGLAREFLQENQGGDPSWREP